MTTTKQYYAPLTETYHGRQPISEPAELGGIPLKVLLTRDSADPEASRRLSGNFSQLSLRYKPIAPEEIRAAYEQYLDIPKPRRQAGLREAASKIFNLLLGR